MSFGEWLLITCSNGLYSLMSLLVFLNSYSCFSFCCFIKTDCMNQRDFPFQSYCFLSCLIFLRCSFVWFSNIYLWEKKKAILSLYPSLQRSFRDALSLTCVSFDLENRLSLCLQCIEQGFSHIHVLLKMQYLIQVSLISLFFFFTKLRLKK